MEISTVQESLCYKMYLASRMMTNLYAPLLQQLNLTFPQFLVMGVLWEKDKQTIKSLSQALHLDSGTLTPLIKRLEKSGLVIRIKDASDERSNLIHLTKKGLALLPKGLEAAETFYEQLALDEEQIDQLKELLTGWIERQSKDNASE